MRALSRGDAAVAVAAFVLLISSFLPYVSADCAADACSSSAWNSDLFPVLPSEYLLGIFAAVLILLQRLQGEAAKTRQILGLRLDQWGTSFAVVALWTALWALGAGSNHSWGAYLGLLAVLALAGAAVAAPLVPALQAPLLPEAPAAPLGYPQQGGYPAGQAFPQAGGYGYPGQQQVPGQSFGGQPQQPGQPQPGGYGFPGPAMGQGPLGQPGPGQTFGGQPQPAQGQVFGGQPRPAAAAQPAQGSPFAPAAAQESPFAQSQSQPQDAFAAPAPAAEAQGGVPPVSAAEQTAVLPPVANGPAPTPAFAPFWFAVPEPRRLAPKDGPAGPPAGDLLPGTWYLAVEQRGTALVAQLQDGSQGVLHDVSGIQRG
ncbi:hypothetical protein C7C46_19290 [Streptomyces tateyamensis]|uniref:Uncharacterized protein n=1 Tax=Streptomyces tateyamensis TaxID=565073 RepID=A0A2V4NZM0_9ACTN|nr:hypothetical protein C7C46_19290 [Streptomyces tateyamensis]